jgi:hypothetical protein
MASTSGDPYARIDTTNRFRIIIGREDVAYL